MKPVMTATVLVVLGMMQAPAQAAGIAKPGVPGVQVPFASLTPVSTLRIGAAADWVLVTDDAVWVAGTKPYSVQRIDPATNQVLARVNLPGEACAGIAAGFGSVWVPVCGRTPRLVRVDTATQRISAALPLAALVAEGGITTSPDSVWLVTDSRGTTLSRVDPATNTVRQRITLPAGSYNPLYGGGRVWVTAVDANVLTPVDAASGAVLASIPVGPKPRFLASGGGAVWTLNQGDGSVTRVDLEARRVTATIALGIPGTGGDLDYGAGQVWATSMDVPLTAIDGASGEVRRQWVGRGGDSLRVGFGAVWLTDYQRGLLWRIPLQQTSVP